MGTPTERPFHVLLMRHGPHEAVAASRPKRDLTLSGQKEVLDVATALQDFISETEKIDELNLKIGRIFYADSDEAKATAELLKQRIWPQEENLLEPCSCLNPQHTSPYGPADDLNPLAEMLREGKEDAFQGNAVILVGHQPLLGWIAQKLTGKAFSINRSEILCLSFDPRSRLKRTWDTVVCSLGFVRPLAKLRWAITPPDDTVMVELKEKIRLKMEGAKLMGAFITGLFGFLLSTSMSKTAFPEAFEFRLGFYVAAGCLFLAVACYFAAYFAYDRLMMPRRFWSARAKHKDEWNPRWPVMRPPSSAQWVLYQNMMHVWFWLFVPATWLVFLGMVSLAYGVFQPPWPWSGALFLFLLSGVSLAFPIYRAFLGPQIGSDD